jgi:adenosylhomocysteine nucleosidase
MIGFVIALPSETPGLLEKTRDIHVSRVNGYDVQIIEFLGEYVYLIYSGVGKVNAAIATQTLIDYFKVDTVINLGTCGAIAANLEVGSLIIPNLVSYYDVDVTAFGYQINQIPHEPENFMLDQKLIEDIHTILNAYPNALSHGKLVCGETFINQSNIHKFNIDEKATAVDMESAAVAQVCSHNNIRCAIIKVVSDNIFNKEKNEEA